MQAASHDQQPFGCMRLQLFWAAGVQVGAESWASLLVELVPQRNVLSPCHLAGLSELPEQEEVPESRDPGAGDQLHGGCLLAFPSVLSDMGFGSGPAWDS